MKDLAKVFTAHPTLKIGILMISLGLLLTTSSTFANEFDKDLVLESWMAVPFDKDLRESEMTLESWMALPFGIESAEEEVTIEAWMSAAWI